MDMLLRRLRLRSVRTLILSFLPLKYAHSLHTMFFSASSFCFRHVSPLKFAISMYVAMPTENISSMLPLNLAFFLKRFVVCLESYGSEQSGTQRDEDVMASSPVSDKGHADHARHNVHQTLNQVAPS